MPLYEYECDAQQHRFEVIQKFSDPPLTACPQCGSPVHKLVASPAFQFKGTGWYITDYAKKDSAPASKTEGAKDGDSKKASEGAPSTDKTAKSDSAPKADAPAAPPTGNSDKST